MGNIKVFILLAGLTIVLLLLGDLIAGNSGIFVAVFLCVIMNVCAYWYTNTAILGIYKAHHLPENDPSTVYSIVKSLCASASLPEPTVFLITNDTPNALIVGRKPSLALTTGLLNILDKNELTAVIAREIASIPRGDAVLNGVSALVSNSLTALADAATWTLVFGNKTKESKLNDAVMFVIAPIASLLVKLATSADREFELDAAGAKLCSHPSWLANALRKLDAYKQNGVVFSNAETHPGTAQLFIVNPLQNAKLSAQFSLQPVTSERIRRLEAMTV